MKDGVLTGCGAKKNTSGDCVTDIGAFDGTNVGNTPVGDQSGELEFRVNAPTAGEYTINVEYLSGTKVGTGQWLQLAVGEEQNETRYFDELLPVAGAFTKSADITVQLSEGENVIRLMNHRRQENTLYSYAALLSGLNTADPGNDVFLSICEWGKTQPQDWGYKVGSSWRILNDISFGVGSNGNPGSAAWSSNNTASITSQYSKAVIYDLRQNIFCNVSYTAGNSLTIKTQRGDLWGTADGSGTVENLYLTDIKGDFDAEVTVKFKPSANYQRGALIAYTRRRQPCDRNAPLSQCISGKCLYDNNEYKRQGGKRG